jgi:hypothetical protein
MSPTISFPMRHSRFLAATVFAAVSFLFFAPESYAQPIPKDAPLHLSRPISSREITLGTPSYRPLVR